MITLTGKMYKGVNIFSFVHEVTVIEIQHDIKVTVLTGRDVLSIIVIPHQLQRREPEVWTRIQLL